MHPHALGGHRAGAAGGGGRSNWGRSGSGQQEVQMYVALQVDRTCPGSKPCCKSADTSAVGTAMLRGPAQAIIGNAMGSH